ncbi:hypothetical protein GHT06_018484 [Daphnia sinensis]|uniref:Integrase catalytic domain-containing protein n=1 Tax=Daphnia sinensis TaxID=1820382 RepID=A0AAD5PSB2_9CRUS|nr:hypothetical protein GHT06_018484 [Daphnia sinensis]
MVRGLLEVNHDSLLAGHLGIQKTIDRILRQYTWPNLDASVKEYVKSCLICSRRKAIGGNRAPLLPLPPVEGVWERIAMDVVGPVQESAKGYRYILVLSDYASRFIRRIRTTAYHPQTDGLVERFNRTLCDMLACYVADEPEKWDKYLPFVTFAYNTAKQASIKETPFYLFFGREPIMPNDIKINRRYETYEDTSMMYSHQWEKAQKLAREHLFKAATRQKKYYDNNTKMKITGSFWIGSFDTIYSQETKLITPLECWRLVNDKKCGENNMQTGPTSISFIATPTVCEEYIDLHKSRPQRSPLQEVQFLFNTPIKDEQLGIRLYSISYAWGTIRLVHKKAKVIYEEGKISQKNATLYISYQPGSSNSLTTYSQSSADEVLPSGTEFEYIVDHTIRIQNSNICITETTNNHVFAATCSEDSTKWILEKDNFYIISQESEMCLTLVSDEILKLEQCSMEEESLRNQQWYFQTINTNPEIVENFPDITLQEIREVKMEQRKTITTTINSPIFGGILKTNHGTGNIIWDMIAWGLLKNGQHPNEKCQTTTTRPTTTTTRATTTTRPTTTTTRATTTTTKATTTTRPTSTTTSKPIITPKFETPKTTTTSTTTTTIRTTTTNPTEEIGFEIIEDNEHPIQQEKPEAASLTLEKVPEEPTQEISQTKGKTPENEENGLPKNINEFEEKVTFQINKLHEQYKIRIETEHENKLAKEIRDVYCQLSTIKRNQAVILAQGKGILAASTIGLPICSRVQGAGQALSLQQCEEKRIFVSAKESKCGFQPFFTYEDKNCTIGIDGWSIHPYSDCFWKSHLVNLNGFTHIWEHNSTNGDWVKQKPSIHMPNLDLITEFEELHLNDFDYGLKSHPAHEKMEMEQLNILNDIVGRMQESEANSVSDIIMSEK